MDNYYSNNKSVQILIALLKANNIKKIIASPGSANIEFTGSIENDSFFEIYSSVDERSAAYLACGLAGESGEPVVLSCTGATASRNYFPGLTEAYYRQLPILAVTSTQPIGRADSYSPQFIDRTVQPKDAVKLSVQVGLISSEEDEWCVNTQINKAILELNHNGKGPVHINLTTSNSKDFSVNELPRTRIIKRIGYESEFPEIKAKNVAIYVGSHLPWPDKLTALVESFCEKYNGAVICDHPGNYNGKYKVNAPLLCSQDYYEANCRKADLIIHIGNVSGAEISLFTNEVWRVNPDGIIRDTFKKLTKIFEMSEENFFAYYINGDKEVKTSYYEEWINEVGKLKNRQFNLPFSNTWIASVTIDKLPANSVLYLGVLNSIRNWDYFDLPDNITCYANTGGFGTDGMLSASIGASLYNPNKLYFGVLGDLSFFYDMNVIGNRHVGNNVRFMVINNGRGTEFTNYNNTGSLFGKDVDNYIAAAGHFGNQSPELIKHYAEDLGYKYLSARNKEEYLQKMNDFVDSGCMDKPIIFEVFTHSVDESNAIKIMRSLEQDTKGATKQALKTLLGNKGVSKLKKLVGKR